MHILWHIKEYMVSAATSGNVNLDGVAKVVSVWCLHYEVTLFPFLYSVRRQQRHEGREIEIHLLERGVPQSLWYALLSCFSHFWLFVTPWTISSQSLCCSTIRTSCSFGYGEKERIKIYGKHKTTLFL